VLALDERLFLILNQALDGAWVTVLLGLVTWLGNGLVLAVLVLPPLFVFDRRAFRRHALPLVVSVALSGVVVNVVKPAVGRQRPSEHLAERGIDVSTPLGTPLDASFPSGHSQTAFGTAVYLSCLYPPASPIFLSLASLVGISRIALGVHYPLDVLTGALVGALFALAAFLARRRLGSRDPPGRDP